MTLTSRSAENQDRKVGSVRPSQLMFSYGVGAIVDLPYLSVLVMGLDDWQANAEVSPAITEERLLRAVQWELGEQASRLITPPAAADSVGYFDPFSASNLVGAPVATFPRWMVCPRCQLLAPLSSTLFELQSEPFRPEQARYIHKNCNKAIRPTVVPARFLVACENGHLDDFPWIDFVHNGNPCGSPLLRLIEYGPGGEARELEVRCDNCGAVRRMSEAFGERGKVTLPLCRGRRPHLRDFDESGCDKQVRTLLLGTSNIWFPEVLTTLAIPAGSARLDQLVDQQWVRMQSIQNVQNVALLRQFGQLGDLMEYEDDAIWQAVQRRRHRQDTSEGEPMDLKTPEWNILCNPERQRSSEDLRLRRVSVPSDFEGLIEKVVLVERMREVRALIGFTRIIAPEDFEDESRTKVGKRVPMSRRNPTWAPATDVRGEGIFVQFREAALQQWFGRVQMSEFADKYLEAHRRWRRVRGIQPEEEGYPGLRYVLLHSFAHILMRQVALECGYTAASVRERIYSRAPNQFPERPEPMAGVLIYTAAPDSEGTLGGLVALGEPDDLGRLIQSALRDAQLCASDPLCSEHPPSFDGITLHGAACHACLFAPETSCERGNRYLDRSVLVPTVERDDLAFFASET
ncbi:MAG: DUF1998 domain-containing protein [Chloroflexota bacterium]|nr:DUF1998 domain-containing protein [Chloroflexota bacterium]